MDQIQQQVAQFTTAWASVSAAIGGNPGAYAPHIQGATPEQLDEVVRTIGYWMGRVRAPKGFAPGFHVARSLAATSLVSAITSAQALGRGEYSHFPGFVAATNQILSALHTMLVFSAKPDSRDVVAELGAKLAESLALLDTAQAELQRKTESLAAATNAAAEAESAAVSTQEAQTAAQEALKGVQQDADAAEEKLRELIEKFVKFEEAEERAGQLEAKNGGLLEQLEAQLHELERLTERAQSQQQLIADLLPKGASAGLASAFALRVSQVEKTKWMWMVTFVASVLLLAMTALTLVVAEPRSSHDVLWEIAHRLPLAAPLIWLGWFSAIQYGNVIRVQEDYAFKEATSKAFAGYRDHMAHMARLDVNESTTAMTLLAAKTIEILAKEPLRVFQRTERDASPSHSVLESLSGLLSRNGKNSMAEMARSD